MTQSQLKPFCADARSPPECCRCSVTRVCIRFVKPLALFLRGLGPANRGSVHTRPNACSAPSRRMPPTESANAVTSPSWPRSCTWCVGSPCAARKCSPASDDILRCFLFSGGQHPHRGHGQQCHLRCGYPAVAERAPTRGLCSVRPLVCQKPPQPAHIKHADYASRSCIEEAPGLRWVRLHRAAGDAAAGGVPATQRRAGRVSEAASAAGARIPGKGPAPSRHRRYWLSPPAFRKLT
jgi:hypothetical protein